MSEAMIECEGLTKRFGTFTAVDHISFSVGKGSIFGFLGPNGSGKSTVIRMLCGILEPSGGTARIGGHDIVRDAEPIKEMIGYMSQQFSLYDELTVNENLIFAGKLYGLSGRELNQRREEMIATTHLEPYRDRRAAKLSGGWRQRLAMACSLMHKARRGRRGALSDHTSKPPKKKTARPPKTKKKKQKRGWGHEEIKKIAPPQKKFLRDFPKNPPKKKKRPGKPNQEKKKKKKKK